MKLKIIIYLILFGTIGFLTKIQANNSDSLFQVYNSSDNDSIKAETLIKLADILRRSSPDSSMTCYLLAKELSVDLVNPQLREKSITGIGVIEATKGNYARAIHNFDESLEILRPLNDSLKIAHLYNSFGMVYGMQAIYDSAINYFYLGLELAEKIENKETVSQSLNNIGIVYRQMGQYEKSLEYYYRALKIHKELNKTQHIIATNNNIGLVNFSLGKNREAVNTFLYGLKITPENDLKSKSIIFSNLGLGYIELEKYDSANIFLQKAVAIYQQFGDVSGLAQAYLNLALVSLRRDNSDSALIYAKKGLELSESIDSKPRIKTAYQVLSEIYESNGNFKEALFYFKKLTILNDSIQRLGVHEKIAEVQSKYETIKNEKENSLLKKDNEIQSLVIKRQRITRNAVIILFGLTFLLGIAIYRRYILSKKVTKILAGKNEQISQQKLELSETLEKLKSTNTELEQHKTNLEAMVKDRVAELEKKNEELENYNSLFVGREFRIKELRDQLKELKKKLKEEGEMGDGEGLDF